MCWRRIIIPLLAVLILFLSAATYSQYILRREAEIMLGNRYQEQFFAALGYIDNLEILINKALVAAAAQDTTRYLTNLWQQSFAAQASLNALPAEPSNLLSISRFLTQIGDYAFVLSQKTADGRLLNDDDRMNLQNMRNEVHTLRIEFDRVAQEIIEQEAPFMIGNRGFLPFAALSGQADVKQDVITFDEQVQDLPTLIYDGPFSDHIVQRSPKVVGDYQVTAEQARSLALDFAPIPEEIEDLFYTEQAREIDGQLAVWGIEVYQVGREEPAYLMDITKQGGLVVWMINPRSLGAKEIGLNDAVRIAEEFVYKRGFQDFEMSYPVLVDNLAIVPFVSTVDDILIYPDQIKVSVALDNAEVVAFDALQYIMAHHERDIPEPEIEKQEALQRLNPELTEENVRLALIPRPDLSEVLCYEIIAVDRAQNTYHVYINSLSGDEEDILQIIQTDQGGHLAL